MQVASARAQHCASVILDSVPATASTATQAAQTDQLACSRAPSATQARERLTASATGTAQAAELACSRAPSATQARERLTASATRNAQADQLACSRAAAALNSS